MRRQFLVILAVGFLLAADDPKVDRDKLQGTWVVVSAERDGKQLHEAKDDKLTFSGDKITIVIKERTREGTCKLDPNAKPKQITITPAEEGASPLKGVYVLEGDTLKLCLGKDRPSDFTAKSGTEQVLLIFKREK